MNNDSPTSRLPLRIGLLIDSFVQRKWIHQVISDIQSSGFAEIAVVIKNEATQSEPSAGRLKSYWHNREYLLYALYGKIDERRVKVSPDAFEPVDLKPLACGLSGHRRHAGNEEVFRLVSRRGSEADS